MTLSENYEIFPGMTPSMQAALWPQPGRSFTQRPYAGPRTEDKTITEPPEQGLNQDLWLNTLDYWVGGELHGSKRANKIQSL